MLLDAAEAGAVKQAMTTLWLLAASDYCLLCVSQAKAALLFGVIVALQGLVAIQLQTFTVYLTPSQDLAYVLATG